MSAGRLAGPLPNLRDYLEIRSAFPTSLSPDASKVLVLSNLSGTYQAYRVPRTGGPLEPVTALDEPVNGWYLPTGGEVLLTVDSGGNEHHQLYLVADDGTGLRPLVRRPEHIHRPGGVARDGSLLGYASNDRNGVDFDVHVLPLEVSAGASHRRVFDRGGWCEAAGFSPDGRWLAVSRLSERNGDNDVYLVDLAGGEVVHASPHDDEASFGRPAWLADSSGFLWSTDTGRDRRAIARFDMATRSSEYVLEPEWDASCLVDWTGRRLLVTTNEDGYTRARLHDPTTMAVQADVNLPGRGVADFAFSQDGRHLVSSFTSPTEPGDAWAHDIDRSTLVRLTRSPRGVDAGSMVEPELHRYTSFDGEAVPVFAYVPPPAATSSPRPVIVMIHGGPESQYRPAFSPLVQYFTARGYAVVAPNVRGSTGYGKRYHHLDDGERRLDAVADLAALHDWLAADSRFDAERAVLWGGSYGGYMVLAGLALQPERWAAGVDIVGISSLVTFLENTSAWRRAYREREYGWLERDRVMLTEASPITHVESMRSPLFIIHGANDPRVPLSEAEQIHAVLRAKGVRSELAVYPDEGHGLARLANRLDAYPRAVDFIDEVLRRR
ncbi:MAG: S9 family peptidase [Actinomycetota bacterium]|nr:S9 family peptidase [Actinomycetota bacterium]